MSTTKKYWQSVEQLQEDPEFMARAHNEFSEPVPVDEFLSKTKLDETSTSRRDFLKFLGFSVTAASLAACETPVMRSIPYVVKPDEITPGIANYYASSYADGMDYASILVKTREGRPIHISGNSNSGVTHGGVNARVNSSVLSLYDSKRLQGPQKAGTAATWDEVDGEIGGKLQAIANKGGNIRILSNTIMSPSTKMAIGAFATKMSGGAMNADEGATDDAPAANENVQHITYDAVSASGIRKANEASFGAAIIPGYHFDKAKVIVSVGADFLSTWLSSIEYAVQYGKTRNPNGAWMSKHYQFESNLSLTGSNADVRGAIRPSEYGAAVAALYNEVAKQAGGSKVSGPSLGESDNGANEKIAHAAKDLWKAKGSSLVVSGSNDIAVQTLVNGINDMLGNYGSTIDLNMPINFRQGNDEKVAALIGEMKAGKVDALIVYGADPVYSMPAAWDFAGAMAKVGLKISFASKANASSAACDYVCPDHHYLESWGDVNPKAGYYSLTQPVINPLYNTRQAQSTLLKWAGMDEDYHNFVKGTWEKYGYPMAQDQFGTFASYWAKCLHDGVGEVPSMVEKKEFAFTGDVNTAASKLPKPSTDGWELELYMKTSIGEGNQAGNPWLQELPDPISKIVWDNYVTMNPVDMHREGFNIKLAEQTPAHVAKVMVGDQELVLPVVPIPGQKLKTIGIAVGYGNEAMHLDAQSTEDLDNAKRNAFRAVGYTNSTLSYTHSGVSVANTGVTYKIASTQTHDTMMGRKIVNETTLDTFKSVPFDDAHDGWNPPITVADAYGKQKPVREVNLWADHGIETGHRWGMAIDLNLCNGCGACVTSCHSENNVPVVGKDEVRRTRAMSWLRIDRYFSSDADPATYHHEEKKDYAKMEIPSAYPDVVFQPVMCQHCNHAPCETVCPVAATTHSDEGLNQMTYNRCVGTRYCANNCPYKVRRFNWFNYVGDSKFTGVNPSQDDLSRMVLNPDVVVRSRGVMEKCSMCVQRIQSGKLEAKKAGGPVEDGAIQTACSSACPTHAITFGDLNDSKSNVRSNAMKERSYHLMEEIGTQPNIWYMTKVRNAEAAAHSNHHVEEEVS